MKRLFSLITALAAFVGFAEDPPPADADASTSSAESPLCVGFSFNNNHSQTNGGTATAVNEDTNGTVKNTVYALEDTVWFYSEAQNAESGTVENVFPFTVEEATTPEPDNNTEGGNAGGSEAGGTEGGQTGGESNGQTDGSNGGSPDPNATDDPASPDSDDTSPATDSEGGTTPTAKPKITWTSKNVWNRTGGTSFLHGFLDDGDRGNGQGIEIKVTNFASKYADGKYDVIIYFSTGANDRTFLAPSVNGTNYTFDAENPIRAKVGDAPWGHSSRLTDKAQYGVNALRVCDLTGDLTIVSPHPADSAVSRACVAAIQIVPAGHKSKTPVLTIPEASVEEVKWSTGPNWNNNNTSPAEANNVVIDLKGSATLDLDIDIKVTNQVIVAGAHTLTLKKSDQSKSTAIGWMPLSPATIVVEDAFTYTNLLASVTTLDTPLTVKAKIEGSLPFASVAPGRTFAGGAGSETDPVSYTCAGGSLTLKGEGEDNTPFYIADAANKTFSGTDTTVTFDGADVKYNGGKTFAIGHASFVLTNATVEAEKLILSQGADNRHARLTLDGKTVLTVTGTSDVNQNTASIMFGHYNGQSTFTLNGESQFLASSQVLVGKTKNNHTININGGLFSAKGIALAGWANGTNKLNLNGGTLALGEIGLSGYRTTTDGGSLNPAQGHSMAVTVGGNATMRAKATTFPIWHPVTIATDKTLTLDKTNSTDVATTTYKFNKSISGDGKIEVKPGVNVQFGTARPKKLKVENADSEISFTLSTESGEEAVIQCEGLTSLAKVKIYEPNGTTEAVEATYATLEGNTLTIKTWQTLNCEADKEISFEEASNWSGASGSQVPSSGNIIIKTVAGKTCTVTVGSNHSYGTIYVIGTGTVVLKGKGVLTPSGNVTVRTGAKLKLSSASVIAEGKTINLLSDSTLAIVDLPSSTNQFKNVISGAGRVETFGDVQFTKASNFSGGLTVKRGTASVESTTSRRGFGGAGADDNAGVLTVENGGCLDLAHTWNLAYTIRIAGMGVATTNSDGKVTYSGALKNSATGFAYDKTQTRSLTLTADALITVEADKPWGILASGWGATTLNFAGHTLTKQGAGEFFLSNVQNSSTGVLAIKEGKLTIYKRTDRGGASNLSGTKLFLFGNSTLDLVTNLNGLSQLRLCPSAGGVTVNNIGNLAASTSKMLTGAGFEGNKMTTTDGTVVLVKGTAGTITNGLIASSNIALGSRFKKTTDNPSTFALDYATDGSQLTATLQPPTKFFHYDFNNANASDTDSKASDSVNKFDGWGDKNGSGPFIVNKGRSGKSGNIFYKSDQDRQIPHWSATKDSTGNTTVSSGALDSCGALTATTVARLMCASRTNGNVPLWGLGSLTEDRGKSVIGLVAIDSETVAAVAVDSSSGTGSAMRELARVTGIKNLTTAFHFFALVVTGEESRLYVDRMPPAVTVGARAPLNAMANKGQIGAFHGGSNAYPRLQNGDGGFYLDDFQVYDAILSDKEIQELRRKFCPDPFFMIVQ